MKLLPSLLALLAPGFAWAAGLTIYNQNFAVVRETIPLDLKQGVNEVKYDGATLSLEPDSVILRDPSGAPLQVLEQNYRNDPVTQGFLLSLFEGKTIDFYVREPNKPDRTVKAKVIRSGYAPAGSSEPVLEIEGKVRFGLPGEPVFPSLGDDTILRPQLVWKIASEKGLKTDAEVGYVTAGLSWEASYNIVSPEKANTIDLVGWVTVHNQSGRDFYEANIQLMAGDVQRIEPEKDKMLRGRAVAFAEAAPAVSEKAFDEFHLYTLQRPTTLRDRQTKQVEFVRGSGVASEVVYVYDATRNPTKVAVRREFKNTKENGLGFPLPKGRVRFYRTDGAQLQFTGENQIDHTPADELVKIQTGEAFDLVGERKRTNSNIDNANKRGDESFEITLRNRKQEPVTIRVVEHLYRWNNWEITEKSDPFTKTNSNEVEFRVDLKPGQERKLTYTVHYSW